MDDNKTKVQCPHSQCSLVSSAFWYLCYMRLWGLLPFSLKEHHLVPSKAQKMLPILYVIGLLVLSIVSPDTYSQPNLTRFILYISSTTAKLIMGLSWLYAAFKSERIAYIFQILEAVDYELLKMWLKPNYLRSQIRGVVILVVPPFVMITFIVVEWTFPLWTINDGFLMGKFLSYYCVIINLICHQAFIQLHISERIWMINSYLEKIFKPTLFIKEANKVAAFIDKNKVTEVNGKIFLEDISPNFSELGKCHLLLLEASFTSLSMFEPSAGLVVISAFLDLLANTYALIDIFLSDQEGKWFYYFHHMKWNIFPISFLLGIILPLTSVANEANKTRSYLCKALYHRWDAPIRRQLKTFITQLGHKVEFNTFGLFNLDLSCLLTALGAMTTYVMILVQLKPEDMFSGPFLTLAPN